MSTDITHYIREALGRYLATCDEDDMTPTEAEALLRLALAEDEPDEDWTAEWVDDAWHLVEPGWYADADGTASHYECAANGAAAARDYVDEGDWGEDDGATSWVHIAVWRRAITVDRDGYVCDAQVEEDTHRVEIEPACPACAGEHDHEWIAPLEVVGGIRENPGCWGHGGGVVYHEVCRYCGLTRITDTWAQDPATGEQGLTRVSYEDREDYRDALAAYFAA